MRSLQVERGREAHSAQLESEPSDAVQRLRDLSEVEQASHKLKRSNSWRITSSVRLLARGWRRLGRRLRGVERDRDWQAAQRIEELEAKLWGGFSRYALEDLKSIIRSPMSRQEEASSAAWSVAKWYMGQRHYQRALENMALLRGGDTAELGHVLLEAECLTRLGKSESARSLVIQALKQRPDEPDLCLAMANTYAPLDGSGDPTWDEIRLSWINRIYEKAGLLPLVKADFARALDISNLATAPQASNAAECQPKISVIMPVYQAEKTLPLALKGLLAQTWLNLEIIIVDDRSSDGSFDIAQEFAKSDPRIVAVRQAQNGGPYVARNRGLELASGDYVTVHDADDWSHAQKIERHFEQLKLTDAIGVMSNWVRVSKDLHINGPWARSRTARSLINWSLASLIVPTSLARAVGGWDPVRVSADAEFIRRLRAKFGEQTVPVTFAGIPWTFALDDTTSLTLSSETHVRSFYYGLRAEYRRAYERWHESAKVSGDFLIGGNGHGERKFPVPPAMLSSGAGRPHYEVVFVCDFAMPGGTSKSVYHCILAAVRAGLRVGVFNWPRYDLAHARPIDERTVLLIDQFEIDMIVAGEEIVTEHLVIMHPPILKHRVDRPPQVAFKKLHCIVNQMANQLYNGGNPQYDPQLIRNNLEAEFGQAGEWCPISPLVHRLMTADQRYPSPSEIIWTPLIDTDHWCRREILWRGGSRRSPVIGRHGRGHYTKWPSSRDGLAAAYCVHKCWETRFLGGAQDAIELLGRHPQHWRVMPFSRHADDVYTFVQDLDFLIHFPHEDYIEEFGRCAMEAMASGIPAILPHRFQETFADAAVYCEPEGVAACVEELWGDEEKYLSYARAGREFVLTNCSLDQFRYRLCI